MLILNDTQLHLDLSYFLTPCWTWAFSVAIFGLHVHETQLSPAASIIQVSTHRGDKNAPLMKGPLAVVSKHHCPSNVFLSGQSETTSLTRPSGVLEEKVTTSESQEKL